MHSIEASTETADQIREFAAYVVESLKSGMHPSFLTEEEQECMRIHYGNEWYKKFGYDSLEF